MKIFVNRDCLEAMPGLADKSVDMILCDLPYGTTACKWDVIIPFEPLWKEYKRIIKGNGAIVLTASQPFTSMLVMSNLKMFKYEWIWEKNQPTGIAIAKSQPMRSHESIMIFSHGKTVYNKQPTTSNIQDRTLGKSNGKYHPNTKSGYTGMVCNKLANNVSNILLENVCPRTVLKFNVVSHANGTIHPTQKPVALFEYLIKTYTNEGETVLDNCAGSGTTAIACINLNRKYICYEKDRGYFDIATKRITDKLAQEQIGL